MTIQTAARPWRLFAALGDSFSEGLGDDARPDGRHRGWADLVAQALADRAAAAGGDGIDYANLAIRGRLTRQVISEQVPAAVALQPDLTSLAIGVNDTLRRHFDVNAAATQLEAGVRSLRSAGSDVLVFAFGDPGRRSAVMGSVRDRIRRYNSAVEAIADLYGCYLVRYWDVAVLDDDRFWADDRLHLSPAGHRIAAASALEALGLGGSDWRTPAAPGPRPSAAARTAGHAQWAWRHVVPWTIRRFKGASSGDGITPKHPGWIRVEGVAT